MDEAEKADLSELIVLDAQLAGMINNRAFRAVLGNGHDIVAFLPRGASASQTVLRAGVTVKVRMSPFDMSRGEMILELLS
jgi:translation initiation factor IF-1